MIILMVFQSQLSACTKALESSEELLELANQTLCSSGNDSFTQVTPTWNVYTITTHLFRHNDFMVFQPITFFDLYLNIVIFIQLL